MSGPGSRRPAALGLLAAAFLASAALRAGDVIAALPAVAEDGFGHRIPDPAPEPQVQDEAGPLIADLQAQRARLDARARALDERAQTLEALEAAGRDVEHLARMYARMKPKEAAQIFDRMTPSFAAGFLGRMKPEAAALIMADMGAEKAYAVSLLLATRNMEPEGPR